MNFSVDDDLYRAKQNFDKKKWQSFLPAQIEPPQEFSHSGILLIDKPVDISSTDVIRFLKRICKFKKIGHAGTLDPFAQGLLIILLNKATKSAETLMSETKIYTGKFSLGFISDTQDISGNIKKNSSPELPSLSKVQEYANKFCGKIFQTTPLYSARKIKGKPLYKYARAEKQIETPIKEVEVFSFDVSAAPAHNADFFYRIVCGRGTYVRTLVHDLGERLGCGALTVTLCREQSGSFTLAQSSSLGNLQTYAQIEQALQKLPIEK